MDAIITGIQTTITVLSDIFVKHGAWGILAVILCCLFLFLIYFIGYVLKNSDITIRYPKK